MRARTWDVWDLRLGTFVRGVKVGVVEAVCKVVFGRFSRECGQVKACQALGDLAEARQLETLGELRLAEEDQAEIALEAAGAELVKILERGEQRVIQVMALVEAERDGNIVFGELGQALLELLPGEDEGAPGLDAELFEDAGDDAGGGETGHVGETR